MDLIKKQFPFFENNKDVIYLDTAATALKPMTVIKSMNDFYSNNSANPHSQDYGNASLASQKILNVRKQAANLLNANSENEIIFTEGTTYSLNQVAFGLMHLIDIDDEIIITNVEHSSNFAPWVTIAAQKQAKLVFAPINNYGQIIIEDLSKIITSKTKIIVFNHMSNVLGATNDIKLISTIVKKINKNIIISVDAAQSIAHEQIDVQSYDIDFLSFSAHKFYGPFGCGILWGKSQLLKILKPLKVGGGSIYGYVEKNNLWENNFLDLPFKLEAGTPNIPSIIGFGEAINFVNNIGINKIKQHELELKQYARLLFKNLNNKKIKFLNLELDSPIIDFYVEGINSQDIGIYLWNDYKICVRTGKHCAKMLSQLIKIESTIRVSFGVYNSKAEIDILKEALENCENFINSILV
ncbi:aminotransferase class V-fold PLP-dependent enzyme [Spiroplasma endosymbiont of Labia minor]|uniref:aminotransferase class V-fold PLP-dependent enzyme n=1 Tax=Spiroplasma endosymbiont of Labia minor TaxID=3066305 RepID=UPI0030CEA42A